jgi:hypothetical protein
VSYKYHQVRRDNIPWSPHCKYYLPPPPPNLHSRDRNMGIARPTTCAFQLHIKTSFADSANLTSVLGSILQSHNNNAPLPRPPALRLQSVLSPIQHSNPLHSPNTHSCIGLLAITDNGILACLRPWQAPVPVVDGASGVSRRPGR